tara:strand:+ start:5566 stop:6285 length:720 start_codon:yes stop_codon:yes gene_type:complete
MSAVPSKRGEGGAANMSGKTHGGARATKEGWRDLYATPSGVLDVVERCFGNIHIDLAAEPGTAVSMREMRRKVADYRGDLAWIGPDHELPEYQDALEADWVRRARSAVEEALAVYWGHPTVGCESADGSRLIIADNQIHGFLNPPFGEIAKFAEKAMEWGERMRVTFLCYGREETKWFRAFIEHHAREVKVLFPRVRYIDPRTGELRSGGPNVHSVLAHFVPGYTGSPSRTSSRWDPRA